MAKSKKKRGGIVDYDNISMVKKKNKLKKKNTKKIKTNSKRQNNKHKAKGFYKITDNYKHESAQTNYTIPVTEEYKEIINDSTKKITTKKDAKKYKVKESDTHIIKNQSIIERGDIYYVHSHPKNTAVGSEMWSDRPAIIVSNNTSNKTSNVVEVVYLTTATNKQLSPTHVKVIANNKEALAIAEQVHTVSTTRLGRYMGKITKYEMKNINEALLYSLGIETNNITNALFKKWENHIKNVDMNKEINIITATNTEERVEKLQKALDLAEKERDAYKSLFETSHIRETY